MSSSLGGSKDVAWYKIVRDRMDKENELITGRLNWLIASQSFLFTAYSLASQRSEGGPGARLRFVVPVVAIGIGSLIYLAILAGFLALKYDRALLLECLGNLKRKEPGFPRIQS